MAYPVRVPPVPVHPRITPGILSHGTQLGTPPVTPPVYWPNWHNGPGWQGCHIEQCRTLQDVRRCSTMFDIVRYERKTAIPGVPIGLKFESNWSHV